MLNTKRVVFFIRSLHVGGAEKQSIYLTKELSKYHKVKLVVFYKEGEFLDRIEADDDRFFFLEGNVISKIFQFYKFLNKNKTDVLFNFLPINNVIGTLVGKFARVPYIFNGIRVARKSSGLKMMMQRVLSNYLAYGMVSNSNKGKEAYIKFGFKERKINVIHNLIIDVPERIERKKSSTIELLTVGRFVDQKDYPTLLLMAKKLKQKTKKQGINWNLTILGYGVLEEEIKALAKVYQLEDVVKFRSGKSKLDPYFKNADIYVSSSRFEGMPNVIMEAMSYSLPVVATDAGDSNILVTNDQNGYLCPIQDSDVLSERCLELILDKTKRQIFGVNSYDIITQKYSPETIGMKYNKLIENL